MLSLLVAVGGRAAWLVILLRPGCLAVLAPLSKSIPTNKRSKRTEPLNVLALSGTSNSDSSDSVRDCMHNSSMQYIRS